MPARVIRCNPQGGVGVFAHPTRMFNSIDAEAHVRDAIGTPQMRIDVGPTVTMQPRDRLLIARDGLFDNARVPEIAETIRRGPLESAVVNLVDSCHRRMTEPCAGEPSKPDDLSFILYGRQGQSAPQARGAP
ncbi:MAG: hypothetical protein JSU63_18580 [Phycisphaerales bacterium]|nr:MAG: hypothetical protein JSU63_18580 [Phycisphaerales bacterium]